MDSCSDIAAKTNPWLKDVEHLASDRLASHCWFNGRANIVFIDRVNVADQSNCAAKSNFAGC
ncbi:MAG TPA: hypothetical protein DDX19_20360 [Rhodopirellula baltica]|nr:hypothetical protein [Rhodopirellula baltica]